MSHTPGPWATVDAEWLMSQRSGMGYRYFPVRASGHTWDIANVFADEDDDEMFSNAQLIAAAPELLVTARRAIDLLTCALEYQGVDDSHTLQRALERVGKVKRECERAVAKAEGRMSDEV